MTNQVISAITGTGRVIGESYKLGFRAWAVAPAIVAIAVVPEFVQHIAEIRLGMFESVQRFSELAQHPTRWLFGYAKVAGMVIAMLAIARFWAVGSVRKTFLIPPADLGRLVFAVALTFVASLPFDWVVKQNVAPVVRHAARLVSFLLQSGLTLYVVAALFGDRSLTLKTAFTERWPSALVLAVAVMVAFLPGQLLHMLNHKLALGQPAAIVWALMAWDALVVGMIATLVGSALWAAYRSGATWQGWSSEFAPVPAPVADAVPVIAPPVIEKPTVAAAKPAAADPAPAAEPTAIARKPRRPRPGPRPRG